MMSYGACRRNYLVNNTFVPDMNVQIRLIILLVGVTDSPLPAKKYSIRSTCVVGRVLMLLRGGHVQ